MSVSEDTSEKAKALEALLVSRNYLYTLFHQLFGAAPDAELLEALLGDETATVVGEYAGDDTTMQGLAKFLEGLSACESRTQLLSDARDEYTRLFVGPAALPAFVWESPYRSHEATLFQENTLAVRLTYRASGFEPRRMQRVPDDHVALMCAFMAKRAGLSLEVWRTAPSEAFAEGLREQGLFVGEHMTTWLSEFAKQVRRSRTAVLYPQMIEAFAAFVALDAVFLAEAAFWVEGVVQAGNENDVQTTVLDASEAERFFAVEQARDTLATRQVFGIEDYELVSINDDIRTDDSNDL